MRVLVTGATGFVGSAVVRELTVHGHRVVALARSAESAERLESEGVEVHRGDLADLDGLRSAAASVDGVVHTAFANVSATTTIADSVRVDRAAVAALGDGLAGTDRPFVVTSVTALLTPGVAGTEADVAARDTPRGLAEIEALAFADRDVRVSVVRLPPSVHGPGDVGWIPALVGIARSTGISGYLGDGSNRWPAVHRLDAASLFRLALEHASAGSRLHAVADEGVPLRTIADAVGRIAGVPVAPVDDARAEAHFGFLARFVALDGPCSSEATRRGLGWRPVHPTLLDDLESGRYDA